MSRQKEVLRRLSWRSGWLGHLLAGWLLLLSASAWALQEQPSPLLLRADTQQASLAGHLGRWVDAGAQSALAQAREQIFSHMPGFENAGFTNAAHWYLLQLARTPNAPTDWLLVLEATYLDSIEVWIEQADGTVGPYRLGDHVPMAERPVHSHQNVLALALPDIQPRKIWLRVTSTSMMNFSAHIYEPQTFTSHEAQESLFSGFLLGVILVVVLAFGVLGLMLGEHVLLAYAAFVASQGLRHLLISGYSQMLFDPQMPWQSNAIQGLGSLAPVLAATIFFSYLLNLRVHFPRLFRVYQMLGWITALALCFITTPAYLLFAPLLLKMGALLSLLGLVLTAVLWWQQRRWDMLLYFFGFMTSVVAALLQWAIFSGWLSIDWFSNRTYQTSTLVHIGVMSLALALRLYLNQRDQAHVQQKNALVQERQTEQRRFIAMLSHEFRNPLASIDRAANLLQLKLTELHKADGKRLSGIRSSVRRLESLVDSFLVSEAVEQHRLTPVLTQQEVAPMLANVIEAQGAEAQGRLRLSVAPPDLQFALDARLIGIAVGNLLGNALRYSGDTGTVSLTAQQEGDNLLLTVVDQGPGLSEAELALLGVAYYRAGTSMGKQGTGLGYFFSRSIVEAHGGTLQAANQPERGLRVSLRLPGSTSQTHDL